jgi:hypothetical protein
VKGYLYVADESGAEIEGSRRYLTHCETHDQLIAIRRQLEALAGEGCNVMDSEVDRQPDRD